MNKEQLILEHIVLYYEHKLNVFNSEDGKIYKLTGLSNPFKTIERHSVVLELREPDKGYTCIRSFVLNNETSVLIKPILRPMSDLTKEELRDQGFWHHIDFLTHEKQPPIEAPFFMVRYLASKHFDIHGLIAKGLAIDINTLNKSHETD